MAGRRKQNCDAVYFGLLPPVQFANMVNAVAPQGAATAQARDHQGIVPGRQPLKGGNVHVVVMVVRDQHNVNGGKL